MNSDKMRRTNRRRVLYACDAQVQFARRSFVRFFLVNLMRAVKKTVAWVECKHINAHNEYTFILFDYK
ncbi:hypothetical protein T06_10414 [Trichinella sp. T6]|nr:hypothetical protein T06_10414 [Trichinella sp. T6]